jgi:hypothetical protein
LLFQFDVSEESLVHRHGGIGQKPNLQREWHLREEWILWYYFGNNLMYDDMLYQHCYKMQWSFFLHFMEAIANHNPYKLGESETCAMWWACPQSKSYCCLQVACIWNGYWLHELLTIA